MANNQRQVSALTPDDYLTKFTVANQIKINVALQERSEHDPYVTILATAEPDTIDIVINRLHPYYESLETSEAIDECIRQFVFDAIAEYKVHKQQSAVNPDSVRRGKDTLLRVQELRIDNAASTLEREELKATIAGG